jgi:hypothetical protein
MKATLKVKLLKALFTIMALLLAGGANFRWGY